MGHLIDANDIVRELRRLDPMIMFPKVRKARDVVLCTFSDAGHPKDRDYGQTGMLVGILSGSGILGDDIFPLVDWCSHKQSRVSHSAYGAEILAAATSEDRGYYFKMAVNTLFPDSQIKHEMNVDSKALWDTVTSVVTVQCDIA